jgi:SAM-dependent methyltransferase
MPRANRLFARPHLAHHSPLSSKEICTKVCARPPPLRLAQTVGLIMVKISDPHGLHDWSSKEYVRDWATRQDHYEVERRPQFQMIADTIPFSRDAAIQILDVGAGYGALTQFLLEQFPNAAALCQDGSEEMAKLGRQRMAKWKGRFDYVIADFSKRGWSRPIHRTFDAVVSTIAIHNVRVPGIIEAIYKEVFQLVKPGGCFLNLDLVFVPLAKQLDWLRAAGFSDVRTYWQERREALFGGRKIQETVRGKNRPSGRGIRVVL